MENPVQTPVRTSSTSRAHTFWTSRPHATLRLLKSMLSHGCELNAVAYCTVVGRFYDENFQFEAYELFDEILRSGICPDITTFNKLMHILRRGVSKKGLLKDAASMVDSVRNEGLSPDVVTYNTLICGLSKSFRIAEAKSCLQKMHGHSSGGNVPVSDTSRTRTLVGHAWDTSRTRHMDGDIDRAMGVFNEALSKGLKPCSIIYNTLIKVLSQQGLILQALQLMNEIPEKGAPSIFTFNTLIDGFCKQLKMDNAIEILNSMWGHNVIPDVITYNSGLNGLCKTSKSDDVMETLSLMVEKGCVPDIITYNMLMESLCKARKFVEALSLLEEIENKGLTPDNLQMDMSQKLFHEMIQNGCPTDNYTYCAMVDGFCKTDNVDSAYNFLHDNLEKGFIPSLPAFGHGIVPDIVNTIFEADKMEVAVPKIVVEELLKKSHITYYAYEILYDSIRDKKLLKKKASKKLFS
ncbi:pentatricopeptide repeat (PPR) superfamily protein [Actinidia rufa]|uniref:Pentatricopeptide repeat (PPR) superfamily protein n=1 Tax=Actinidia rufa TaxID=165716 RepID=A0A7J0H3G3_9ERIC|nr:pentatricopeptide repeat (PPR) superfamily protein [Actinidia rufa]